LETKAALINSAILEDRTEVRVLKDRIYQLAAMLTTASFAVTAFVLGNAPLRLFLVVADLGFLVLLWALFLPLRHDLVGARKILEYREEMLRKLGTPEEGAFVPYPVVPLSGKPRMKDPAVDWLVGLATATLIAKMGVDVLGMLGNG